jgi:hypothetical protein
MIDCQQFPFCLITEMQPYEIWINLAQDRIQ